MKKTKPAPPPPPSHIGMRELEDMFSEAGLPLPTIEYKVTEHGAYRYLLKWTGRFLEQAVSPPGTTCTLPFVATQSVRMTGNVLAWLRRKGFSLSEVIPDSTLGHLASYFLMSPKVVAEACAEAGYKDARPDTRIAELSDEVRRKLPAIAKRLSDETRPQNKALLDEQGRTTPMASQKSHHAALPAPAQPQDLRDQDRRRWVDVVGANGYFRPSGGPESVRHDLAKDDPRGWSSDKRRHAKRLSARAAANEATSTHKLVSPTQATPAANKISAAGEPAPTDDTIQKLYYTLQRETNKHLNLECRATSDGGFWVTAHLGSQKIGAASGKSESIARRTVCQNILGAIQVVGIHSWLETLNQEGAESWQTALDSSLREMPDVVQKLDKPVGLDLEAAGRMEPSSSVNAGVEAYEVGPNGEKAINAPLHLPGTITNDQILMGGTSLAPFSSVADTPSMTTSCACQASNAQ